MKKHQKHAKLTKPEIGNFGRNEVALVGAPCDLIQVISQKIISAFPEKNCTYIDADHAFGDSEVPSLSNNELIDKIKFFRQDKASMNDFDKKIALNDQDLILVNGNHFEAQEQLVLIHPKKEASLKKRLSQLSNVIGYVLCEDITEPFDWLIEDIGLRPVFNSDDVDGIKNMVENSFTTSYIKGLVLAGGKSLRMGSDKGQINYHGISQVDFLLNEFKSLGLDAYVSCRPDQYEDHKRIIDKFEGLGPYGAILSAFQTDPNAAWLVSACDLPLVNAAVFETLIKERDSSKLATCFYNPETDFPDPLITLWEPKGYMRMLEFLALGYSCPRKVLINSDVKVVQAANPAILKNVNTLEEKEQFLSEKN
ncbi:NTP transferase domain-containing protein [Arcticibacterium luteifluviistationis]|uniref:Molybdopterin-guanine dinucleotide biosynthesis protein MobA n=1 Tax=Arcticibacterium luteifluviistationis TaxID=1784714 RepID=A0A2Z4GFG8_9BACT|nr:NTP transferase domain-containing protein [Arcticibacterium luteifluviistationis]AWV99718.1 molybdopterin-guanine dinucleotide biosynthesis protein MobA [Arcticibacterium luteifluviistationis]